MGNTFFQPTCSICGAERQPQFTGRPGEYCSTRCRQKAARLRQAGTRLPDTEQSDQALRANLRSIQAAADGLLQSLDLQDQDVAEPLALMVRLQVLTEHLTPHMVSRTKERGATWEKIGALLGMSKDTVRKKFPPPARRSARRAAALNSPPLLPPVHGRDSGPPSDDSSAGPPTTAIAPAAATDAVSAAGLHSDLASVLSSLQRASGLSLRALASRSNISPSFLSRMMIGERFPAWKNVAAIARVCGADPEVLRQVWEASNARRDRQPSDLSLAAALRFLHQRAGSPTPWAIAVTSAHELEQDHITALLNGTTCGTWPDVERLVQLLDGEPTFFRPLWEAEPSTRSTPEPLCQPPVRQSARDDVTTPSTRVEELLSAFRDTLSSPRRPAPASRRYLAAPIHGLTPWSSR